MRNTMKVLVLLSVFGSLAMVAAAAAPAPTKDAAARVAAELARLESFDCGDGSCWVCWSLPRGHAFAQGLGGYENLIGTHDCIYIEEYPNCTIHVCGPEDAPDGMLAVLEADLPALGADELLRMSRQSNRLVLNRARMAVQVLGCRDDVIITLNLTPKQAEAIDGLLE